MEQNNDYERFAHDLEKFIKHYLDKQREVYRFHFTVFQTIITLIVASLGLTAALAWDEFFKLLFQQLFGEAHTLVSHFLYALLITVIAVVVSVTLGKAYSKHKNKEE